jgi:dUTPase
MAVFYHVIKELPRYTVGERIGQIKLGFSYPCEFEFVDEINESTERGSGGFGSTGNN